MITIAWGILVRFASSRWEAKTRDTTGDSLINYLRPPSVAARRDTDRQRNVSLEMSGQRSRV